MEVAEDRCLDLSSEANELRWLTPGEASEVLTYDCDRAPVRALDLPADTERTVSWTLASRVSLAAMGACLATVVGLYLALHGSPQAAGDWLILVAIRGVPRDAMLRDHPSEPGAQIVPGVEGS